MGNTAGSWWFGWMTHFGFQAFSIRFPHSPTFSGWAGPTFQRKPRWVGINSSANKLYTVTSFFLRSSPSSLGERGTSSTSCPQPGCWTLSCFVQPLPLSWPLLCLRKLSRPEFPLYSYPVFLLPHHRAFFKSRLSRSYNAVIKKGSILRMATSKLQIVQKNMPRTYEEKKWEGVTINPFYKSSIIHRKYQTKKSTLGTASNRK